MRRGLVGFLLLCIGVTGCAAVQSFPAAARPGDTIALAVGWNKILSRQNMTITITPAVGGPIIYEPGDARVRAVIRLYPDPVSRLIVGTETQQGLGSGADAYGALLAEQITRQEKDWWQTMVYVDLPPSLPPGAATVTITGPDGPATPQPLAVEILPGIGSPATFGGGVGTPGDIAPVLASLERAEHVTMTFTGSTVPQVIQVELLRTPEVGKPWLVNPRGDLKNLAWSDDGSRLRVLLLPTHGQTLGDLAHFKFHIAGGVTGLQVVSVKAYDSQGKPVLGIAANLE